MSGDLGDWGSKGAKRMTKCWSLLKVDDGNMWVHCIIQFTLCVFEKSHNKKCFYSLTGFQSRKCCCFNTLSSFPSQGLCAAIPSAGNALFPDLGMFRTQLTCHLLRPPLTNLAKVAPRHSLFHLYISILSIALIFIFCFPVYVIFGDCLSSSKM